MTATYDFTNKVALVTGASQGIGFSVAKGFAENGARVVLSEALLHKCGERIHLVNPAW
ncbi:SDR family NAD(P)-dependent oxidoreductase [Thioclava sp. SK-1]|uniref:SDR family NAD(P)-dependent oxidoreductase n=1 Tax=Thioclava sp. SK-1 TaxID=1889770 RepID=UPI0009F5D452|nr:SDR family NAD(P)-dependent oxidoreductase [Thioclava sp. SK-1]